MFYLSEAFILLYDYKLKYGDFLPRDETITCSEVPIKIWLVMMTVTIKHRKNISIWTVNSD